MADEYWKELDAHLTDVFNIKTWDEGDSLNKSAVLFWTGFTIAATQSGAQGARERALEMLERYGEDKEPEDANDTAKHRNLARDMAQSVLAFTSPQH